MDAQLRLDVRFITTRLGAIIREQAGEEVFQHVERLRGLAKKGRRKQSDKQYARLYELVASLSVKEAEQVAHAFSLFFQLVNLCEERARIRKLREAKEPNQSLHRILRELSESGVPAERIQSVFDSLEIEPVLTAHPTETKRESVLYHLWRLRDWPANPDQILETLWQTEEVRRRRPQPLDEVENALSFFNHSIFDAVAGFYEIIDCTLGELYPCVRLQRPFLTFASWIGGDRDGNPHVTPQVSRQAVQWQQQCVLAFYRAQIEQLFAELSHARKDPDPGVAEAEPDVQRARETASRNPPADEKKPDGASRPDTELANPPRLRFQPDEVFRRQLLAISQKLWDGYRSSEEFVADLALIRDGLYQQNAHRAARGRIARLIRQAQVFGFHLAELDFRDESTKLRGDAEAIREQLRTQRDLQLKYGTRATNRYVLSMTHSAGDLRKLLALAAHGIAFGMKSTG